MSMSFSNLNPSIYDWSMASQGQAYVVGRDSFEPLQKRFCQYKDQKYNLPPEPHFETSSCTSTDDKHVTQVKLQRLLFEKKWNGRRCISLLRLYTEYKTLLSCAEEKDEMWIEVAKKFHERSNCPKCFRGRKKCWFVSASKCREKIEKLRVQYHSYKNLKKYGAMARFFDIARNAFENSMENSVPTSSCPSLSSVSLQNFKWSFKGKLLLLRLYTIYKPKLSSPNCNESVWNKIAEQLANNYTIRCVGEECHKMIGEVKTEYEGTKHIKPYESSWSMSTLLDEAENAFENNENPVIFSIETNLAKYIMSKPDKVKLLQVYGKYKEELLLQNFDVEKQIVWGKVAREISEKCSSFYGKRRCCYEINHLKILYEKFKVKDLNKCGKPFFFDQARIVYESTECAGEHTNLNKIEGSTVKQEKNDCDVKQELCTVQERRGWYDHANI